MSDIAQFSSECPRCGQERLLTGYAREELAELLREGADIEAYCSTCEQHWPISTEERADLARALDRGALGPEKK
jgi:redox-regulated HSP33 family molecular chaperone